MQAALEVTKPPLSAWWNLLQPWELWGHLQLLDDWLWSKGSRMHLGEGDELDDHHMLFVWSGDQPAIQGVCSKNELVIQSSFSLFTIIHIVVSNALFFYEWHAIHSLSICIVHFSESHKDLFCLKWILLQFRNALVLWWCSCSTGCRPRSQETP